jgi:hypothetical protein
MIIDSWDLHTEKFGHFLLGEPEGFVLIENLYVGTPFGGGVQ